MKKLFKLFEKNINSKAFSFVELLCAVVILALVATPILQMIVSSYQMNLKSKKLLAASDLAASTCEFISSNVYDDYTYKEGGVDKSILGINHYFSKNKNGVANKYYLSNMTYLFPNGPTCKLYNSYDYPCSGSDTTYQVGSEVGWQSEYGHVKYNNYDFYVRIICMPSDGVDSLDDSGAPEYFTYDLYVEVFDPVVTKTGEAYVESYNILHPEAPQSSCPFNYSTIKDGCFTLLTCQKVTIANKR